MRVEICANSVESVLNAEKGKAHRVELCQQLALGGLTPTRETITSAITRANIPVHVLIRPRAGDFCYSEEELWQMCDDIRFCRYEGCAGVVIGALTQEGNIDTEALSILMQAASGMHVTFHRAFDEVTNPEKTLDQLIAFGAKRLLTSGQQPSAVEGLPLLKKLLERSNGSIEIMPGAGIGSNNVLEFKKAGFPSVHLSATMGNPNSTSNPSEIEKVVSLLS